MNFPIQACSACGEATENLYCPNCRRKLTRDQIKVFWNPQSWAQYRATVADFKSFSSSLPYLETTVIDTNTMDLPPEEPKRQRLGLVLGVAAAALVVLVGLGLWFTRANDGAGPAGPESSAEAGGKGGAARTPPPPPAEFLRQRQTPGVQPRPGQQAPGGYVPYSDPSIEEVCGASSPPPPPPPISAEEVCGVHTAPPETPAISAEEVCGVKPEPPDPVADQEAEELSQNAFQTPQ